MYDSSTSKEAEGSRPEGGGREGDGVKRWVRVWGRREWVEVVWKSRPADLRAKHIAYAQYR